MKEQFVTWSAETFGLGVFWFWAFCAWTIMVLVRELLEGAKKARADLTLAIDSLESFGRTR
jgi:hypothetical protein